MYVKDSCFWCTHTYIHIVWNVCTLAKLSVGGCEVCILYGVCKLRACYGQVVFVYGYVWGIYVVGMLWVDCVDMGMYCVGCACCKHFMGGLCVYGYVYIICVNIHTFPVLFSYRTRLSQKDWKEATGLQCRKEQGPGGAWKAKGKEGF